ncbi:MAG: YfhO family protein, partial [Candidatus Auribacterota bacterium]|nr:YfhO family protein [Candidatus Auribacterota bacterium]
MKKDVLIILALIGFVLIFWLPALFNWIPLLGDDYIHHHFPIKALYARALQQGTLPWWDPHTFCGAWPITTRPDGGPYYLPDYPILLLTNLSRLDLAATLLVKLSMALHYIWMIVTAYLLGRIGLRLNRIGSVVLSVAYTMSPTVNYLAFAASITTLNSWLPSLWLCLILFIRHGGIRYLALGSIVLALQISGAGFGHMIRGWTFTLFLFAGVSVKEIIDHNWIHLRRVIIGGSILVTLGIIISAPVWLGILEGYRNLESSGVITFQTVAGGLNSLQPGYLATLMIPNLFGSVIGAHGWGVGRTILFDQANLLGGMMLIFLVVVGLVAAWRVRGAPERFWILLSGAGVVFGLFIVLGRHTPVYRFLFQFLPPFRTPYAVRWRDFEAYSMVILAGASASLLTGSSIRARLINRVTVTLLSLSVVVIIALACLFPFHWRGTLYQPGILQAVASGELNGVLRGVLPYLLFCLVVLAIIWVIVRHRVRLLIVGVLIELTIFGWLTFYLHRDWFGYDPLITHYSRFSETPLGKIVRLDPYAQNGAAGLYRTVFYRSRLANSSWLTGGLSLFGYDCKPLLPRFNNALHQLGPSGLIYEMVIEKWDTRFLANMSVDRAVVEAEQVESGVKSPTTGDIIIPVVETDAEEARLADHPLIVSVPDPLPRFFTHDLIVLCSEEEALEELVYGDLRRGVFLEKSERLAVSGKQSGDNGKQLPLTANRLPLTGSSSPLTDYSSFKRDPGTIKHFHKLQALNLIKKLDLSNPNRVELAVDITKPAMLVITDVYHPDWSVKVDGVPSELLQVNYLQRGVWLEKGKHKVIMTFVPESWKLGRWGTVSGMLLVLGMMIFGKWGIGNGKNGCHINGRKTTGRTIADSTIKKQLKDRTITDRTIKNRPQPE